MMLWRSFIAAPALFCAVLAHPSGVAATGFEVEPIEAIGENGDAKEAVDFAWLARQRSRGVPLDLAPFTGASANSVAGALHSGPEPVA